MERKITALKLQKRNPNRVNVYLDGEFAFGVTRIVAAWLKVGQSLNEDKIASLRAQDTQEVAYLQAIQFLSYRPRSEAEVRKRLTEKGFEEPVIDGAILRLHEERFLGDEKFAQMWVENRTEFRPRSHRMLRYELRQKGISNENIESALADAKGEAELAFQAGIRYARRLADTDWEEFRKRLSAFLGRRGFSYGTAAQVVRQIWETMQGDGQQT